MAERYAYVYRLHVQVPPASVTDPAWRPANYSGLYSVPRLDDDDPWRWPTRRLYLSASGADKRAALLRMWGATVTVERSLRVEWPVPGGAQLRVG